MKQAIYTDNAPEPIGTYSQAVRSGDLVFLSGQIPLDPKTKQLVSDDFRAQATQVFKNIVAVIAAAGGSPENIVNVRIYLTDLAHFPIVNDIMSNYIHKPYPARAVIGVAQLPMNALVEIEAVLSLSADT